MKRVKRALVWFGSLHPLPVSHPDIQQVKRFKGGTERRNSKIHRNTEEKNISDLPKWYPSLLSSLRLGAGSQGSEKVDGELRPQASPHLPLLLFPVVGIS